jgi:hypothetical protein
MLKYSSPKRKCNYFWERKQKYSWAGIICGTIGLLADFCIKEVKKDI